jgi:transcriptional regulator with XRE-family HTH domain
VPRSTPNRTIGGDSTVAQRVAEERKAREWTFETLSRRMEGVGCPIHVSALHKLEKGHPPRRVTVDELVAFSQVLDVSVEELITPAPLRRDRKLRRLVDRWWDAREGLASARRELREAEILLRVYLRKSPDTAAELEKSLERRAADSAEDRDQSESVAVDLAMLLSRRGSLTRDEQQRLDLRGTEVD